MLDVKAIFKEPVKRCDLARVLGVESDREARRILSELQKTYNIINLQDGKGYFLADNKTAIRYAEQERKRALKSFNKANQMLMRCRGNDGIEIPVKAHMRKIKRRCISVPDMARSEFEQQSLF
jgi:hypothetical protein